MSHLVYRPDGGNVKPGRRKTRFAACPSLPRSRRRRRCFLNDREEVWVKSQLPETFRGWAPTSPRERTDPGNLYSKQPLYQVLSIAKFVPRNAIRHAFCKAGPETRNFLEK
jgi:hypothetical protein